MYVHIYMYIYREREIYVLGLGDVEDREDDIHNERDASSSCRALAYSCVYRLRAFVEWIDCSCYVLYCFMV